MFSVSTAALVATFAVSNLDWTFSSKVSAFVGILIFFLGFGAFLTANYQPPEISVDEEKGDAPVEIFDQTVEAKLFALEEAHQFFGASLKYADMFRLVASRLADIVPYATCVWFTVNEDRTILETRFVIGENSAEMENLKVKNASGLAGKTLDGGEARFDRKLADDRAVVAPKRLINLNSGIAVPLRNKNEIFGVLALYGASENQFDNQSMELFKAAAERIAPLFAGSMAVENNLTNALIDNLTGLSNERGFYLVLENQIAEAQRFRDQRNLTVLAIDIKNFEELNCRFGHAIGEQILVFAAENIKSQLRQMDFLARFNGDQFLAVLPTASEQVTREVIERLEQNFVRKPLKMTGIEVTNLQLNFGTATFWKDGETATELIANALSTKKQMPNVNSENNVIVFPKEFLN